MTYDGAVLSPQITILHLHEETLGGFLKNLKIRPGVKAILLSY